MHNANDLMFHISFKNQHMSFFVFMEGKAYFIELL